MKKKLLSFLLAICLIMPCALFLSACGNNPPDDTPHTHNWSSMFSSNGSTHWLTCDGCSEKKDEGAHTYIDDVCSVCGWMNNHQHTFVPGQYEKNDDYHWQDCTTCDGISEQEPHEMSGDTCIICGHIDSSLNTELASIRDLEIITYQTDNGGVYTLVKLPDGKNMLIDAGGTQAVDIRSFRRIVADNGFATIDYMVLTNAFTHRTGGAEIILANNVKNFYIPDTTGATYTISDGFRNAVSYANTINTCNVISLNPTNEDSYDVTSNFSYNQQEYSYTIDFMTPVAPTNCETEFDASIFVAITYQNKVVLFTGDATNKNIDNYANADYDYNVDVLITGYEPATGRDAIRLSDNRGSNFLTDIGLTNSDHVIITNPGVTDGLGNLVNVINAHQDPTIFNSTNFEYATVKITGDGTITVSPKEPI